MRDVRHVFWGIVTALVSIILLLGVFALSQVEGTLVLQTTIPSLTITLTSQPSTPHVNSPTPLPPTWTRTLPPTWTFTLPPTWTPTLPPPPTNCPPPSGWLPYLVQPGDTLGGLALRYTKTSAEISLANCLGTDSLLPGQVVYLPPLPSHTPVLCGPPNTWVIYIVQQGDTLFHLGLVYGIPYTEIKSANCLTSSNIHIGQQLYVPPWATRTSSPTLILFSDTQTEAATGETSTPTDAATPTPTETMPAP
jgi:LysM repeat protein